MRLFAVAALLAACAPAPVGVTHAPLAAVCSANVTGVGMIDAEADYLPRVVRCENGAAPPEALKAQAVAARTYLYFKMETAGAVADGQGDQTYTCNAALTDAHRQAVKDTAGLVMRYDSTTIAAFYVAGGKAAAPGCVGAAAATEKYVTYNEGLSGAAVHQSTLGFVDPSNDRNRGCLSQNGSACLAGAGRAFDDILRFYYGADIALEQAVGACVGAPLDAGERDAAPHDAATGDDEGGPNAGGCSVAGRRPRPAVLPFLVALVLVIFRTSRRDRSRSA